MNDRIICVMGFPSGGTTMIAGILQRLGVDIGPVAGSSPVAIRDYPNLEDLVVTKYMWSRNLEWSERNFAIRAYIDERVREQQETGVRVAFKFPCIYRTMQGEGWRDWPIDVVSVNRDMLAVFRSNFTKSRNAGPRRAQEVGLMVYQRDQWLDHYKVAAIADYERFLERPRAQISWMSQKLGLGLPSEEVMQDAAAWCDPGRRRF